MARRIIRVDTAAKAAAAIAIVHKALGMTFPIVGVNAATGLPAVGKCLTTAYVTSQAHPGGAWWGVVVDELIALIRTDATLRARLTVQQRTAIDAYLDALVDEAPDWFTSRT